MDPSSDSFQINKNCENVFYDSIVSDSTIQNHNGSYPSNLNKVDDSDKFDIELSEDQVVQQSSSCELAAVLEHASPSTSTIEKIKEAPLIDQNSPRAGAFPSPEKIKETSRRVDANSDHLATLGVGTMARIEENNRINRVLLDDLIHYSTNNAIETRASCEVKKQHTFIHWEMELRKQDAIWQKMFEQNRQIDLYSLCSKYFREVKQNFGDDKLFQQWFEKQKKIYPHRMIYQRIKL